MKKINLFLLLISNSIVSYCIDYDQLGAVAYFPFEGNAYDSTGNGNDGVISGASETNGRFGRCFYFDSDDFIQYSEQYSPSESITYAFWFNANQLFTYPENSQYTGRIPFHRRGGYADHFVSFYKNRSYLSLYDFDDSYRENSVLIDEWNHVAFGYDVDTKNYFMYYNGEKIIDETRQGTIDWSDYYATYFGHAPDTPDPSRFIGKIDEAVVFNRGISQNEINLLMSDVNNNQISDYWDFYNGTLQTPTPTPNYMTDWILNPSNNHEYKMISDLMIWNEVLTLAESLGGYPVTLSNFDEDSWVDKTFNPLGARRGAGFWIGLTDYDKDGIWEWIDETPLNYTRWYTGQPSGGDEVVGTMNYFREDSGNDPGWWNDLPIDFPYPAIIERNIYISPSPTPSETLTPSSTFTELFTPTSTYTLTSTQTPTFTLTETETPTITSSPTETLTPTLSPTPTVRNVAFYVDGSFDFNVYENGEVLSEKIIIGNDSIDDVTLNIYISGLDFYSEGDSNCLGNILPLSSFSYFAVNGNYSTLNDPRSDGNGFVPITFEEDDGIFSGKEIIASDVKASYLLRGASMEVIFKLSAPNCYGYFDEGDYDEGNFFIWALFDDDYIGVFIDNIDVHINPLPTSTPTYSETLTPTLSQTPSLTQTNTYCFMPSATPTKTLFQTDINEDGEVDSKDLLLFLQDWKKQTNGGENNK